MSIIVSIIGAFTGISGMIFSVIGFIHNRMLAVTSYLEYTREPDLIEARSLILETVNYDPEKVSKNRAQAHQFENVINTYNMMGLLVRKHQLPKWFFKETSTGETVIKFYERLEPYILYRREIDTIQTYGNQFEYLYRLLKVKL